MVAAGFCLLSTPALASDPTPLFVMLVEIPIALLSLLLIGIARFFPTAGRIFAILFLVALFPVSRWASNVGYLDRAGIGLYFAWLMGFFALFVGRLRKRNDTTDSDPTV